MLALTRKIRQKTFIDCPDGTRIEVDLVAIAGNRVKLGFTAPAEYKIVREEIEGRIPPCKPSPSASTITPAPTTI
jgi:carbon storage regulator CsrA